MKHAREVQASKMDIRQRLGEHVKENADVFPNDIIQILVGVEHTEYGTELVAGFGNYHESTKWMERNADLVFHFAAADSALPDYWWRKFFGMRNPQPEKLYNIGISHVREMMKYMREDKKIRYKGQTSPKRKLAMIQSEIMADDVEYDMEMSNQASEMNIQQRLHTVENAMKGKYYIDVLVGINENNALTAGWEYVTEKKSIDWWNIDTAMHMGISTDNLPEDWKKLFFGKQRVPAKRLHKVTLAQVKQMMKHKAHAGHLQKDSSKKAFQELQKKMKSTKASEMAIRQRLMQLDDEISQENAARDMITKVPNMTTKKMKEVLPDLKLSYINLMTLLSLIDSGRNAPEELPKGIGKKELKIAVNEARMIWLWLQSNSIRLGFNFKEYT